MFSFPNSLSPTTTAGNTTTIPVTLSRTSQPDSSLITLLKQIGATYSVPYVLYRRGLDFAEIAERLDLPAGVVKSRVFTARLRMKQLVRASRA